MLLTVACAEPLTANELSERLSERGHLPPYDALRTALSTHVGRGFLRVAGRERRGGNSPSNLYVLTAAGEDALDDVFWRQPA